MKPDFDFDWEEIVQPGDGNVTLRTAIKRLADAPIPATIMLHRDHGKVPASFEAEHVSQLRDLLNSQ